jgi:hypothetical protein
VDYGEEFDDMWPKGTFYLREFYDNPSITKEVKKENECNEDV